MAPLPRPPLTHGACGDKVAPRLVMSLFLLKRLGAFLVTLACASIVIFLVLEILPGNAAQMILGPEAPPETVAVLAHKLGMDMQQVTQRLASAHAKLLAKLLFGGDPLPRFQHLASNQAGQLLHDIVTQGGSPGGFETVNHRRLPMANYPKLPLYRHEEIS